MLKTRTLLHTLSIAAVILFAGQTFAQAETGEAAASVRLTPEQMEAFADLTNSSPYLILKRLNADPRLARLAPEAADARISRRRTGKIMTIVGFTILGVGNAIGSAIIVTTPGYPKLEGHEGRVLVGLGVGLGSLAVGLALGIPGIMKMVATTEVENQALELYSPGSGNLADRRTVWPETAARHHTPGNGFVAPVFALAF